MQVKILSGIYTDMNPDVRASYPLNLVPVSKQSGISEGYLRPADGVVKIGEGPGIDRGGINWNGQCFRVMGDKLVKVLGENSIVEIGDIPGRSQVVMDYGFDRLAILSDGNVYYFDGINITKIVDEDLGNVIDMCWSDGYYVFTDGESIITTELSDPLQINPLKYGSSESDPDRIVSLIHLRNEICAVNRYTMETLENVGGEGFTYQRIKGAQIQKGACGTHACCVFMDAIAFVGSGRGEMQSVYIGANASTIKISTREIDLILESYDDSVLANIKLETRNENSSNQLYVHLPDKTLVYDAEASREFNVSVWFVLSSARVGEGKLRIRNPVWAYNKWIVGDTETNSVGVLSRDIGTHWGEHISWEFATSIVYNNGTGAIFNSLELVALSGRTSFDGEPTISTCYSLDGLSYSQEKTIKVGTFGETKKRLVWFRQGTMKHWRTQKFKGDTQSRLSFLRLEAQIEPLSN